MATMIETMQRQEHRRKPLLARAPHLLALAAVLAIGNELLSSSRSLIEYQHRRLGSEGGEHSSCVARQQQQQQAEGGRPLDAIRRTVVAAPSSERAIFERMEALTGHPAEDEWDSELAGDAPKDRPPITTTRYPHHDGIWGWGDAADQVVLVIPDIRRSMAEYGQILWDMGYAKISEDAKQGGSDGSVPSLEDFYAWRDVRIMEECHRFGWFIDYWMENGLMRDVYTHKVTTPEHWNMLMVPTLYSRDELDYSLAVGDRPLTPMHDPHCSSGEVTGSCEPVAVISAEKLRDHSEGPAESEAMVVALFGEDGKYAITQETWNCIFGGLVPRNAEAPVEKGGPKFSADVLKDMIGELNRLISKYGGAEWSASRAAHRITMLLVEHRAVIQVEANEVEAGLITLAEEDLLGPEERGRRQDGSGKDRNDRFVYFDGLERRARKKKRKRLRDARRVDPGPSASVVAAR